MKRVIAAFLISPLATAFFVSLTITTRITYNIYNYGKYEEKGLWIVAIIPVFLKFMFFSSLAAYAVTAIIFLPIFLYMTKKPLLSFLQIDKCYSYIILGLILPISITIPIVMSNYGFDITIFTIISGIFHGCIFYLIGIHKNPYIQNS